MVRKLPNGKSEFVTVPKANMTDTVVTPVKSSTSGGRGALTNPLSPTALIEGEYVSRGANNRSKTRLQPLVKSHAHW